MAKPSSISGFPEFLPGEQIAFNRAVDIIRANYEKAGAVPIETPAVERSDTLLAKGGNDKEIYGIRRLNADSGDDGKDLALHFDLTVPLARYVAQYQRDLVFPFRRYQIQPVWRGERAQAGRYRQFYQCDIDVIGDGELSLLNDAEMPYIIHGIFSDMQIGDFNIHINNRKILQGMFAGFSLSGEAIHEAIGFVDAIEKTGIDKVKENLAGLGLKVASIDELLELFALKEETGHAEIFSLLQSKSYNDLYERGVDELKQVIQAVENLGVPDNRYTIDLSIARGLDYYTGTIYETKLVQYPELGSICSGGRYDELTGLFSKRKYPGVGISIGLTRLLPRLMELGVIKVPLPSVAPVLVANLQAEYSGEYLKYGGMLRQAGINTEVYLENKKLNAQMKYANRKGIRVVILAGEDEFKDNSVVIKNMAAGEQETVPLNEMVKKVQVILGGTIS